MVPEATSKNDGISWHFMAFHGIVHGIPNMVIEFFRVECRFHGNSMAT
jgi:hypothetical protein